jgi:hypothetical protein
MDFKCFFPVFYTTAETLMWDTKNYISNYMRDFHGREKENYGHSCCGAVKLQTSMFNKNKIK